jgi:hypothetical protein
MAWVRRQAARQVGVCRDNHRPKRSRARRDPTESLRSYPATSTRFEAAGEEEKHSKESKQTKNHTISEYSFVHLSPFLALGPHLAYGTSGQATFPVYMAGPMKDIIGKSLAHAVYIHIQIESTGRQGISPW